MSLKEALSRNKKVTTNVVHSSSKITCDTKKLENLIKKWTKNGRWKFENFANFMELIGVQTPIKLSELDEKNHSFKCTTKLNTEVHISLFFGGWLDFSKICITDGEETRRYLTNTNSEKEKTVPKATLVSKNIKKFGKELNSFYSSYFCKHTLKLDDAHVLEIEIAEPSIIHPKTQSLQTCKHFDDYLLGLENYLNVDAVYRKMMEFLHFSDEDISKCSTILISHIQTVSDEELVLQKILLTNGEMQEYAVRSASQIFHVFKNGNWKYTQKIRQIQIKYHEATQRYTFSVSGTKKDDISSFNPKLYLDSAMQRISELQKFMK